MNRFKSFWEQIIYKIIGKPGEVSLKNRIANTTFAVTIIYGSITIYNNYLFNLPKPTIYASLFIVISYSVLYYFSRIKKSLKLLLISHYFLHLQYIHQLCGYIMEE